MRENLPDVPMGNQQAMDIVWLAGIMDGEGTIALTKNNSTKNPDNNARKTELCFANGDERMILKCVNVLEAIGIRPYVTSLPPAGHQNLWRFRVCVSKMDDMGRLVRLMIPHLTSKREQAILMDKYVTSRLTRPFVFGKQSDGIRHKAGRRRITPEEITMAEMVCRYNDPLSSASTTAREGAAGILRQRKIQSDLTRKRKKSAEMSGSSVV